METGLGEKNVLITGAAGGIGSATARAFAAEGSRLVLHYHRGRKGAAGLAGELEAAHGTPVTTLGADLSDEAAAEALFERAIARLERLDVLVVNAGIWEEESAPLHHMSTAQWRRTLAVNLDSAFFCCRAFLRHLETVPREAAAIVLVASTAALFGEPGHADYAASKSALAYGLCLSLKNEIVRLAPRGRVNCVCPGWVATPMAAAAMAVPDAIDRATATMPLRKIASADDVARAILFLASDRLAGHLSGTRLPVAGGMEGRLLWDVPSRSA